MKKDIERSRAVSDAQREKELAIIKEQRNVEVAKQVAEKERVEQMKLKELAVIDKTKELEIARANMEIYKADSEAALYEAKAIRAKGEAEAAVTAAKYKALGANKEIYLAEVRRDTAKLLYENLQGFKVEMPKNYINGGSGGGRHEERSIKSPIDDTSRPARRAPIFHSSDVTHTGGGPRYDGCPGAWRFPTPPAGGRAVASIVNKA